MKYPFELNRIISATELLKRWPNLFVRELGRIVIDWGANIDLKTEGIRAYLSSKTWIDAEGVTHYGCIQDRVSIHDRVAAALGKKGPELVACSFNGVVFDLNEVEVFEEANPELFHTPLPDDSLGPANLESIVWPQKSDNETPEEMAARLREKYKHLHKDDGWPRIAAELDEAFPCPEWQRHNPPIPNARMGRLVSDPSERLSHEGYTSRGKKARGKI